MNIEQLPGFDKLESLETFDPKAFISDNREEQNVCNFVLALSVIYNDFKDLQWALSYLLELKPERQMSAYYGQYAGFILHLYKLHFSLINELIELIKENQRTIEHPIFKAVENKLYKKSKEYWISLVDISINKNISNDNLRKFLFMIRNKITYHADKKDIMSGYKKFFFKSDNEVTMDAFISRGINLDGMRFYFADAAIEGYIEKSIGETKEEYIEKINMHIDGIRNSLYEIVQKFINVRGYGYRKHTP